MLNTVLKGGLLMPHWHVVDDCFLLQNYEWEYFVCENDCTFISNTHRGVQFFPQILSEVLMRRILPKVTQLSCKNIFRNTNIDFFKSFFYFWVMQFCGGFHGDDCSIFSSNFVMRFTVCETWAHRDLQFSLRSIFHLFCCSISNATLSYSELQV